LASLLRGKRVIYGQESQTQTGAPALVALDGKEEPIEKEAAPTFDPAD